MKEGTSRSLQDASESIQHRKDHVCCWELQRPYGTVARGSGRGHGAIFRLCRSGSDASANPSLWTAHARSPGLVVWFITLLE